MAFFLVPRRTYGGTYGGDRPYWRSVRSRLRRMNTPSLPLVTTMIPLSKNG